MGFCQVFVPQTGGGPVQIVLGKPALFQPGEYSDDEGGYDDGG
jgi:hypothetical protein